MSLFTKWRLKRRAKRDLLNEHREWRVRGYAAPSPSDIKRAVLLRYSTTSVTWVETGTFLGDTAALLAKFAGFVHTIEPDPSLFANASKRFEGAQNVSPVFGTSEDVFPILLPTLSGDVNFWLDGHYSGGITYKGKIDCPVRIELEHVEENLNHYRTVVVMIDDIRCFKPEHPEYADYPPLDYLVDWARRNQFKWSIEHDIFIATREQLRHLSTIYKTR